MKEDLVRISIIYSSVPATLSVFFAILILAGYLGEFRESYLLPVALLSAYPLIPILKRDRDVKMLGFSILSILLTFGLIFLSISCVEVSGDFMDSFILILGSVLIFFSIRDSLRLLYSGLSFYLVGVFLLLAHSFVKIVIILADMLDYYINCIGEACGPYQIAPMFEFLLFPLLLIALYPYVQRGMFRREENDKEGP